MGLPIDDMESVSISSSYSGEWCRLFECEEYFKALQNHATRGKLRSSRFRSICWKLYLEVLPENRSLWMAKTRTMRDQYDSYKQRLIINPRRCAKKVDLSINNPLSQDNTSPWNQFFLDNELRLTIKQDVVRTYPRLEFFHTDVIRTMMVDTLFVFAKLNPDISYRQGMHELLAPLIFVLHCDHQAFLHACEIETVGEVIKELLNPKYIEHDAYAMFCQIMETVEPWYVSKELSPTVKNNNFRTSQPFARLQEIHPSNVIITKLTRIQDYLLKKHDPQLQQYLEEMEITPQLYGIRWVRLLFGREFTMQDLLVLWDAIFADGVSFDLVDYVFVAMLLYLRDALLNSDYPTCLTTLMRYPPVGDINFFIQMGLFLREPNQHPRPPLYTYLRPAQLSTDAGPSWNPIPTVKRHPPQSQRSNSSIADSMMSGWSSLTKRFSSQQSLRTQPQAVAHRSRSRPQTLTFGQQNLAKSSSEPNTLITEQSPSGPEAYHSSTVSLNKIDPVDLMSRSDVFPAGSFNTGQPGIRSCGSTASLPQMDRSPTDDRMSTKSSPGTYRTYSISTPTRSKNSKKNIPQIAQPSQTSYEVAYMVAKLNDMEGLCQRCAARMDGHIVSLQHEALKESMRNEDEIMLALAGLKQVRDVLKGILKPSNLSDPGRGIQTPPAGTTSGLASSSTEHTPGSQMSYGSPADPETLQARGRNDGAAFYMGSSVDTDQVSTTDSSSPEYSENIPTAQRVYTRPTTSPLLGKDIELKDFKLQKNGNSSSHPTGSSSIPISDETMNRYRQSFANYPSLTHHNASPHHGGHTTMPVQTSQTNHQRSMSVGSQGYGDIWDSNLNSKHSRRRSSQGPIQNNNR